VERGARPLLAARNVERLRELGDELGGLEIAVADVSKPRSVRELVEQGDVLVSTVGPFARWGDPAAEAAIEAGARYLHSTGGTAASTAGAMLEPVFAWRGGRIQTERSAKRVASFEVRGRTRQGVSVGSSEHFTLPRIHPSLDEVDVYLGWFGPLSRPLQAFS